MPGSERAPVLVGLILLWTLRGGESTVCGFGQTCVLTCTFSAGKDILIHWFQMPGRRVVHSYYENKDQLGQQIPLFQNRTSLFLDQISRGNASLQLMGVKVEDRGSYLCYTSTLSDYTEQEIELKVEAPIRHVNVVQVNDSITCSSERIYPKPELSWSPNPPSSVKEPLKPDVQVMEHQLFKISSTIEVNSSANLSYSCTISAGRNRTTTLFPTRRVTTPGNEITVFCPKLSTRGADVTWRFKHTEIIVTRTGTDEAYTALGGWRKHVKRVSQAGDLTLQDLTPSQEGTYTCDLRDHEETNVASTELSYRNSPGGVDGGVDGGVVAGVDGGVVAGVVAGVVLVLVGAGIYVYKSKKATSHQGKKRNGPDQQLAEPLRNEEESETTVTSHSPNPDPDPNPDSNQEESETTVTSHSPDPDPDREEPLQMIKSGPDNRTSEDFRSDGHKQTQPDLSPPTTPPPEETDVLLSEQGSSEDSGKASS